MLENDDYNGEYFFNKEAEWDLYQSILETYDEPSEKDKDISYNIFSLEQAISTINELANTFSELSITAEQAIKNIEDFINVYTKLNGE